MIKTLALNLTERGSNRLLLLMTVLLAATVCGFGQAASGTASIAGLVTDPSGATIPGVDVVVKNVGTNISRNLKTNEAGQYEAVALQPGDYEMTVSKAGFATLTRTGITVEVGQRAVVDIAMRLSTSSETVTVTSETPIVETDKTDVSTVINLKDMMNLPMSGRRWDSFALSTPGTSNDGGFGLLSFRGMSGLYNNNMIDGMDNNQAFFSEAKGRTRLNFAYSIDAIQEFQVGNDAFSAQYGRAAGGVVNAVTKSGTNSIHGTGFYLIRDDSLNAANPFSAISLVAVGLPGKPEDRRQQFGGSVGGPIKKDKVFYFLNYEQQKRNFPMAVVPGSTGFFNTSCTAPGCGQVVSFFQSLVQTQPRQGNESVGLGKVDYNLNEKNMLTASVNILRWDSPNGIQTAPSTSVHASMNGSDDVNDETVIGKWTANFSPTFLSELRFQYGRDFEFELPNAPGPSVSTTGGINFGMPNFLPRAAYPDEKRLQFSQNLNWLHGRHSVRFGWDVTRVDDLQINLFSGGGVYSYSSLNNFALDCGNAALPVPLSGCQAATSVPTGTVVGKHYSSFVQAFDSLGAAGKTDFQTWDMAGYIEDSWRMAPNFTLNLGLRYEIQTMPSLNGTPLEPRTNKLNTDTNNFGPRIGLSWDPGNNQKTVVRLGGGIYYGRTQNSTIANLITNNGVRFVSYTLTPTSSAAPLFPAVLPGPPSGAGSKPDIVFADSSFVSPITYQAEFSIEREIVRNTTLSAIYMVNRGQRMPVFLDTNLPTPTILTYTVCGSAQVGSSTTCANPVGTFATPFFSGARPNPNFGFMTDVASVVNTWYNGLVIQARHRFSHGFQFDAGFTWSKAQDDDQNSQTFTTSESASNPFNLKNDYAPSIFDQRKRFTASGVWELPTHNIQSKTLKRVVDGFQVSGILTLADGRPYSPGTTGSPTPGGVTSGILGVGGDSRVPWLGRDIYVSPGANSVDLRLSRTINISERVHWLLIAEGFNVANRYEITGVDTTQYQIGGTTLFPRPSFQTRNASGTNLFGARQIQLGTRITF